MVLYSTSCFLGEYEKLTERFTFKNWGALRDFSRVFFMHISYRKRNGDMRDEKMGLISRFEEKSVLLKTLIFVCTITFMCCSDLNKVAAEDIDIDSKVDITVDLEDDSRYLTVDVIKIGSYDGTYFTFEDEVKEYIGKDYYRLSGVSEIKQSAISLAEVVSDMNLLTTTVKVESGKGTASDLDVGLYLIVQTADDKNAKIEYAYIVEAPAINEETGEYTYSIVTTPEWDKVVWFTFRAEVVRPVVMVISIILLIFLCFLGDGAIRVVFPGGAFILCGYIGMKLASNTNLFRTEFIWQFVIFMVFAFLGTGIAWGVMSVLLVPLNSVGLHSIYRKNIFWITAFLGALGIFYILDMKLHIDFWIGIAAALVCGIGGAVFQYLRRNKEVEFYTYEDLMKLPREE